MRNDNRGVSKIIGVVILVVIVIMLSVGVLFTAQTLIGGQPQDMTAGTTDERVDFYTHEAQLVNQGNTDTVYAISPLGTEYKLETAGDLQKILPLEKGSHPGVDQYQIVGEREGQRQLLKTSHFEEGVKPDVVVHDEGDKDYETIQAAINNIDDDTERTLSSENPGIIVVQKGVYKENIEVSDNINLIAEYGTVIQDANPNEDVVDIRGDNVRFQNFEVDGNPNPEDKKHYARHGINVQGSDAVIQGNTIRRADSPDVTSASVNIAGKNALVRYNNMLNSQQSIHFDKGGTSPAVCGNQFENGIGGELTSQTQRDVATLNHWNGGMPTNLARTVIATEQTDTEEDGYTLPEDAPRDVLENTNSRVDPTILGEDAGQAALPFTGTKMGSSSSPGKCELSIGLTNSGTQSINIEEIQVTINGRTTTIQVVEEVNLGSGESSDTRDGPTATCDCGGDGTYDPGDRISVSESSFGEIQTYTTEGEIEPLVSEESSSPTPSSFNVEAPSGTVDTTSTPEPPDTTVTEDGGDNTNDTTSSDNETTTEPDFRILLGSSIDINLADEVILEPVISGAESPQDEIQYDWSLGDGSTSTDRVVRHVYSDPGTYTVELTVTDPATGETDTDSTTVTVQEGTKDVEKIQSDEQQRLADLVQEDPDGDGKVLYLEEDVTYDTLSTISAQDLTIIGQGDNVTLNGPITVTSSGVTFKNVDITDGLIVQNNNFKLYNSEVSNVDGYAVELNANGGGFQIGDSKLTGQNGVYVGVDNDVLLSGNIIDATNQYGVYTEEAISNVRVRDNTITSGNIGIYESLAVDGEYTRNDITAPTAFEQQEATAPEVNSISAEFTTTDVPLALSTQVNDPDGYPIDEVTWEVNGETFTQPPGNDLVYTFDKPGEYTISVTVTDQFGKTTTKSKTVQVEEFEASLTTSKEASVNDDVTASVDYNIPEYRVHSIKYEWGDGTSDVVGSSSYTHAYTEEGDFDISVTVNPDEGESRTVTNSISIVGSPVADFAIEDPLIAGEPIQFNGAYSTAPDGGNLDYSWNMGDGTTYTSESPQHTYATTGTYTVTLTVSDGDYSDSISANLEISRFNSGVSGPSVIGDGKQAEFDVSTGIDTQYIDSYTIDANDDGVIDKTVSSSPFTYTFTETGEREVTIQTINSGGDISQATTTVDVRSTPAFDISTSSTSITEGSSVDFSAINVDATNPTYSWDFDDGTTATGKDVTHTFSNTGQYAVSLTVTGDNGIQETKTVYISSGQKVLTDIDFKNGLTDWTDNSQSSSPISVVDEQLVLQSDPGTSSATSAEYDKTFTNARKITFDINKFEDDGSQNTWTFYLTGPDGTIKLHHDAYRYGEEPRLSLNGDLKDTLSTSLSTGGWEELEFHILENEIKIYKNGQYVGGTTTQEDWSQKEFHYKFHANSWNGGGAPIGIKIDNIKATTGFEETGSTISNWKLDENSGTAIDSEGPFNSRTVNNPSQGVTVDGHTAYNFDGNDDYVRTPGTIARDMGAKDFTISTWVRFDSLKDQAILTKYDNTGQWKTALYMDSGDLTFRIGAQDTFETDISTSTIDTTGQWYHVTGTYDGNQMKLYVDGKEVATKSESRATGTGTYYDMYLGVFAYDWKGFTPNSRSPVTGWLDGQLSEVQVNDKALTQQEVQNLYSESDTTASNIFVSDFETEPTDSGAPDNWNADSGLTTIEVTANNAASGTQSVYITDDAHDTMRPNLPSSANISEVSWEMYEAGSTYIGMDLLYSGGGSDVIAIYNGDLYLYGPDGWNHLDSGPNNGEWVDVTVTNINSTDNTIDVHWTSPSGSGTINNVQVENFDSVQSIKTHTFKGSGYFDNVKIEYED